MFVSVPLTSCFLIQVPSLNLYTYSLSVFLFWSTRVNPSTGLSILISAEVYLLSDWFTDQLSLLQTAASSLPHVVLQMVTNVSEELAVYKEFYLLRYNAV
jgi:hypothetical protein